MPIYDSMEDTLRTHLENLSEGVRVPLIPIGELTPLQHQQINTFREQHGLPPLESPEILYLGRHHYNSRSKDGYTVEDMVQQIASSLHSDSTFVPSTRGTAIENPNPRNDGYGNQVNDRAVLELTSRKPKSELYSVIPKGDTNKPKAN